MSTIATLVTRLQDEAGIESSEDFSPDRLTRIVSDAILKHAPQYQNDSLPDEQDEAVVVQAWISVCFIRAGKLANQPDTTGGTAAGANRDSPYYRNMDMVTRLTARYNRIVESLKSPDASGDIQQGSLVVKNRRTQAFEGPIRPAFRISLEKGTVTATSIILRWNSPERADFADFYIFTSPEPELHAEWSAEKVSTVPNINPAATFLIKIGSPNQKSIKLEDLDPGTEYYFLVVMKTLRAHHYYSNELRVVTLPDDSQLTDGDGNALTP